VTQLIQIQSRPAGGRAPQFALWQLGFRPFDLLAACFAALSIPLWALQFSGWLTHPYLNGPVWHAHEMLFGFTLAVIAGFLFTAGRDWTNRPTPTGMPLGLARRRRSTPLVWVLHLAYVWIPLHLALRALAEMVRRFRTVCRALPACTHPPTHRR
jgi:uncharacterized protein involved in response to NO